MGVEDQMIDVMRDFSKLTQSTLSAFHKAGIDADLSENMDNLKVYVAKETKKRKLVSFKNKGDKVERLFTDGYTDVVDTKDIYSKSEIKAEFNEDFERISKLLKEKKYTPFAAIKRGRLDTCNWRDISELSEMLSFITYDE